MTQDFRAQIDDVCNLARLQGISEAAKWLVDNGHVLAASDLTAKFLRDGERQPPTERVLECSTCEQPHGTPIQAVENAGRMECPWCLDRNNLRVRGGR